MTRLVGRRAGHPDAHKTKWTVKDLKTRRLTRHNTREQANAEAFHISDVYGHCPFVIAPIYFEE